MNEVQILTDQLKEEKWTRTTIAGFTVKTFSELNSILKSAEENGTLEEMQSICSEHLAHTPHSILAHYILGKISLLKGNVNDDSMRQLLDLFMRNRKFGIVEFLARQILKYLENGFALRALAESLVSSGKEKELTRVWERLVKIDYEEADLAKKLASLKEKEGNIEEAVSFYKKALLRYIKKRMFGQIQDIWIKLIELAPEDIHFFFQTERRVAESLRSERARELLSFLGIAFRERDDCDTAIELYKKMLTYEPHDKSAREALVECFSEKHRDHSNLKEYIELSGLEDSSLDVHRAIDTFEKHIVFDIGNYVHHRRWGIGICRELRENSILIDFENKPHHKMTLQMAVSSLQRLPDDHIWLLKKKNMEKLRDTIMKDVERGLRIVIRSYGNEASLADIKQELLDGVLTKKEWAHWWERAKAVLKKNPHFGTVTDKRDTYFIRKQPLSLDEDLYSKFRLERSFIGKLRLFYEFIRNSDIDSEYFDDMLKYFTGFVSSSEMIDENSIISFVLLKYLQSNHPHLSIQFAFEFTNVLEKAKDIHKILPRIPQGKLKEYFLILIRRTTDQWPDIYLKSFYEYPMKFLIDKINSSEHSELVDDMLSRIISHYRIYPHIFVWVVKNLMLKKTCYRKKIDFERMVMGLLHLLEISNRALVYEKNLSQNRKLFNTLVHLLFNGGLLIEYIMQSSPSRVEKLLQILNNIDHLRDEFRIKTRLSVKTAHPEIQFQDEVEPVDEGEPLFVTRKSYELKQQELKFLNEKALPVNEEGLSKSTVNTGDDANQKALKEHQVLKREKERLRKNLQRAHILNPKSVKTDTVSIGTVVTLNNLENKGTVKLTLLGPWEADSTQNVISYTSPLGKTLLNHAPGDVVITGKESKKKRLKIQKIEPASV